MMLLVSVIITVSAQTSQLATLLHDGNMSVFYGSTALKEAHEAAVAGDVITLSAGQFNACTITKPLTIRGAGMGLTQVENFVDPTVITGDFIIDIPENETYHLILEGLQHNTVMGFTSAYNVQFIKCILGELDIRQNATVKNFQLVNSDVRKYIRNYESSSSAVITIDAVNSCIKFASQYLNYITLNAQNSILELQGSLSNSLLNNCILTGSSSTIKLNTNCTAFYCVWYGQGVTNPFPYETASGTNTRLDHENVFKEGTFYELTDELKALKTTDGTQVGIYGGNMPFDPTTTVPQISKFSVSPRTSADGKLSIDIEVEGIKQ